MFTENATGWVSLIVNNVLKRLQLVNGSVVWENVLKIGDNFVVAIY